MIHVAFIGIDGSGKSSLSAVVAQELERQGVQTKVIHMKKNNNEVILNLEKMNPSIVSEEMKLLGYTFDLLSQYIDTSHMNEEVIVWDRYSYCLKAYFSELNIVLPWQQKMLLAMEKPDLTFLLDIDSQTAVKRILKGNRLLKPLENEQYLGSVREHYLKLHRENDFILMDAHKPLHILRDEVLRRLYGCMR
ncbi:hypothetical protein [Paenibacillus agilis]|uniref:Thymidylate kinase n=1 Tax=Paenibacillus agilis TaxID=3020863 RepID=A0A559J121_9BACL|nr:hypothetical protein [Paenibacillus agilis]TVX93572.1 hypothetical protein FPZ44_11205 [Paenibacillus agilis]